MIKQNGPDLRPVLGVGQELEQVLLNLLANAWHAMPGGADTITTERQATQVCMAIPHRGYGIPEEPMRQLFELFFTTTPPGARHRAWTGCGTAADRQPRRPYRHRQPGQRGHKRAPHPAAGRRDQGCLSPRMSSSSMIIPVW